MFQGSPMSAVWFNGANVRCRRVREAARYLARRVGGSTRAVHDRGALPGAEGRLLGPPGRPRAARPRARRRAVHAHAAPQCAPPA